MARSRWMIVAVAAVALLGAITLAQDRSAIGAPSAQEATGETAQQAAGGDYASQTSREWWTQLSDSAYSYGTNPYLIESLTEAELEAVEEDRQKLIGWMDTMLEVHPHLSQYTDPGGRELIEKGKAEFAAMPAEELAVAMNGLPDHEGFWQYPQFVLAIFEPEEELPPFYADVAKQNGIYPGVAIDRALQTGRGLVAPDPEGFGLDAVATPVVTPPAFPPMTPFPPRGSIDNPDSSRPGCPGVFSIRTCMECPPKMPLFTVFAAKTGLFIAEFLDDASGDAAMDICSPPGVGFTVPKVWKYVFTVAKFVAEGVVGALEFYQALADECEGGYIAGLIDLYLDETVSSRVSQQSLDEHARSQLRIAIENNLLNQADDRVSLFQLPESICGDTVPDDSGLDPTKWAGYKWCGQLEYVREIVEDTIVSTGAAGYSGDVALAQAELAAGDAHYMNGQWKSAYERYSQAYRYAVRQSAGR